MTKALLMETSSAKKNVLWARKGWAISQQMLGGKMIHMKLVLRRLERITNSQSQPQTRKSSQPCHRCEISSITIATRAGTSPISGNKNYWNHPHRRDYNDGNKEVHLSRRKIERKLVLLCSMEWHDGRGSMILPKFLVHQTFRTKFCELFIDLMLHLIWYKTRHKRRNTFYCLFSFWLVCRLAVSLC